MDLVPTGEMSFGVSSGIDAASRLCSLVHCCFHVSAFPLDGRRARCHCLFARERFVFPPFTVELLLARVPTNVFDLTAIKQTNRSKDVIFSTCLLLIVCLFVCPRQGCAVSKSYPGQQVRMEEFWAGVLWTLKIWLYLIIGLIMIPAMLGFSLGISEAYMTLLVKTLEVRAPRSSHWRPVGRSVSRPPAGNVSLRLSSCAVGHSEDAEGPAR